MNTMGGTKEPECEENLPLEETASEESSENETQASYLNDTVWKRILLILAGCGVSWAIRIFFGIGSVPVLLVLSVILGVCWYFGARLLLTATHLRKFWIIWLFLSLFFLFIFRPSQYVWIAGLAFSFIFLLFRLYHPYRYLTSRRRAAVFLIGFFVFLLLTWIWNVADTNGFFNIGQVITAEGAQHHSGIAGVFQNVYLYSLWSLRFFWAFSLFHIFIRVRLHFLNLRPKLAVGALLIAVVPILLLIAMGLFILYSTLGASRAVRAKRIMEDWAVVSYVDMGLVKSFSDAHFTFNPALIRDSNWQPEWLPDLRKAIAADAEPGLLHADSPRSHYLWAGSELWILRIEIREDTIREITGVQVDKKFVERVSFILQCRLQLHFTSSLNFGDLNQDTTLTDEEAENLIFEIVNKDDDKTTDSNPLRAGIPFGASHLDVLRLDTGKLSKATIILTLRSNIAEIASDIFSEKNPLGLLILSLLILMILSFIALEIFALYFGIRITTGITSAVKALKRGTRSIAAGQLDTRLVIPNEDELGELAHSFNSMAVSIKKGREEAIEREKLEQELKTARQIQERLLPNKMPKVFGFEIAGTSLPSLQVGGDYFDFLDMGGTHLGIAIGDVSGKGIPAALLMANLQASLHGQAIDPGEVSGVVSRINDLLVRSTDPHMFTTFIYGILDKKESQFTVTNAGHNPPIWLRAGKGIERIQPHGMVLGFMSDQEYHQQSITFAPGDVFVMFTDGVTEAMKPDTGKVEDKLFGDTRLIEVVESNREGSAREIQSAILKAVYDYEGGRPQNDDITLVVIKRLKDRPRPS
ncbi:PP2C family protein-serine/threonine phosphatase, partial [Acidobacteriota bacterium]